MATSAVKEFHPSKSKMKISSNFASAIAEQLGMSIGSMTEMLTAIHAGFSVNSIDSLVEGLSVTQQELLKAISLSSATLTRRRQKARLTPQESDRVFRVTSAFVDAIQLFEGDTEAARKWFTEPARALRGDTPLQHLDTEAGATEVRDLIGRLEHGVVL